MRTRRRRNTGRCFYQICPADDGTVDIYLFPDADGTACHIGGIIPWDELEEDVRKRYNAWCQLGTPINNERNGEQ